MIASTQTSFRPLFARLSLVLALGLLPLLTGCVVAVAGAAAGAGAIAYVRGELESSLDQNYNKAVEATRATLKELEFARISEKKDAIDAEFIYRTALDKKVTIKLNKVTSNTTKVKIRIDILGDEALSISILEEDQGEPLSGPASVPMKGAPARAPFLQGCKGWSEPLISPVSLHAPQAHFQDQAVLQVGFQAGRRQTGAQSCTKTCQAGGQRRPSASRQASRRAASGPPLVCPAPCASLAYYCSHSPQARRSAFSRVSCAPRGPRPCGETAPRGAEDGHRLHRARPERPAGLRRAGNGLRHPHAHPGAGHSGRARRPRRHRLGPDRHGQDRGVCAAHPPAPRRGTAQCAASSSSRRASSRCRSRKPFKKFAKFTDLRVTVVYGGVGYGKQREDLARGMDILVATPGRLLDYHGAGRSAPRPHRHPRARRGRPHARHGLPARREAHRRRRCRRTRQTLFFTATLPPEIEQLAAWALRDPFKIAVSRERSPAETVSHAFYPVVQAQKFDLLAHLLEQTQYKSVIIFSRTKSGADYIASRLKQAGHTVRRHARRPQPARAHRRRSRASSPANTRCWSRPTSPRAASTSPASRTSSITTCRKIPRITCTASAAPAARRRPATPSRS